MRSTKPSTQSDSVQFSMQESQKPEPPFSKENFSFGSGQKKPSGSKPSKPKPKFIILAIVLGILAGFANTYWRTNFFSQVQSITTSEFVTAVEKEDIKTASYNVHDGVVTGLFKPTNQDKELYPEGKPYTSTYVGSDSLAELMAKHPDVVYSVDVQNPNWVRDMLFEVVPFLLLAGLVVYGLSRILKQNSQSLGFGKIKVKSNPQSMPNVKFSDVAGIDEAVEELQEVKDFLVNPSRYHNMGAKIPRGVLLVGPPGTGKTLLAKAVAGEAGVPFFSISGSEFLEMFVGVGASRVRDLFAQAKASAPAIIFIDEIDAVGRQRGAGVGGSHDEREQTLNQLLVELDGFEEKSSVILIAATNRPDILDPALLRPGRFDRQIVVSAPDVKGRKKILGVHAKNKPIDPSISFDWLASLTPGFTGADLANLMNESALLAARRRKPQIEKPEFEEAMERSIAGPQLKSRVMPQKERVTIAYHEAGHALVGHLLEHADPVHKITIISRGQALGYTLSLPDEDKFLDSKKAMLDKLAVLLAGRSAEEIFCDDITTGASNDLERATKIARHMVSRYGMSDTLGLQVFGEAQHEVFLGRDYANKQDLSDTTALRIDKEVDIILREAHERAREILREHKDRIEQLVAYLLQNESVEGEKAKALLDGAWDAYVTEHPEAKAEFSDVKDSSAESSSDTNTDEIHEENSVCDKHSEQTEAVC